MSERPVYTHHIFASMNYRWCRLGLSKLIKALTVALKQSVYFYLSG